jgi:hypothetical protein
MPSPRLASVIDRLVPEVEVVRAGSFALRVDLHRLDRVRQAGAVEAVVLYCSRILEVLTGEALLALRLKPLDRVASDLDTLFQFSLLPAPTLHWAHALRRKGNDARHIRCHLSDGDAEMVLALLDRWLRWFFCSFRRPDPLPGLTRDGRSLWDVAPDVQAFIDLLERPLFPLAEVTRRVDEAGARPVWLRSSTLAAVVAEMLLDRSQRPQARRVIDSGLDRYPGDLRLQQLLGLWLSRGGQLDRAQRVLEKLRDRNARDTEDIETHGILAGVYKRKWDQTKDDAWLARCHRAYAQAWERSHHTSTYHGVNAAATALWLGSVDDARQTAGLVRDLLRQRQATAARRRGSPRLALSYWDMATLAEALLLCGESDPARDTYRLAFALHADQTDSITVSRAQALRHLPYLSLPPDFLDPPPVPPA